MPKILIVTSRLVVVDIYELQTHPPLGSGRFVGFSVAKFGLELLDSQEAFSTGLYQENSLVVLLKCVIR